MRRGGVAQEAKERPNFAEIIQVLRGLLADEARRAPSTSPCEQARRAARLHPASSGSGDVRQAQQVLLDALTAASGCCAALLLSEERMVQGRRCEARRNADTEGFVCVP